MQGGDADSDDSGDAAKGAAASAAASEHMSEQARGMLAITSAADANANGKPAAPGRGSTRGAGKGGRRAALRSVHPSRQSVPHSGSGEGVSHMKLKTLKSIRGPPLQQQPSAELPPVILPPPGHAR